MLMLIALCFTSVTWSLVNHGVNHVQALSEYSILVIAANLLISSDFGLVSAFIVLITTASLSYLQFLGILLPDSFRKTETQNISEALAFSAAYGGIVFAIWVSARQTEKAQSDNEALEEKMKQRTEELKKIHMEKISRLYRFAEFGRISSGLFHDLANPLTAVALSIQGIKQTQKSNALVTARSLQQGIAAAKRMEKFMDIIRKQLVGQEIKNTFSLHHEVRQAVALFHFKARSAGVSVRLLKSPVLHTWGNSFKFHQITVNLISNAIDSYDNLPANVRRRDIEIGLHESLRIATLTVQDFGCGISPESLEKIFDPFFTSKTPEKGTGIGLSMAKYIIEAEFRGIITAESELGKGSVFTVKLGL